MAHPVTGATIEVAADVLAEALALVDHAVAPTMDRPILNGVLFDGDKQGLRIAAADNYRIAIAPVYTLDASAVGRIVVRADELPALRAWLKATRGGAVTVERMDAGVRFTDAQQKRRQISVPWVDGQYPDYMKVMPAGKRTALGIDPAFLIDAARAAKLTKVPMRIMPGPTPNDPVVIEAGEYTEIIMPVRIVQSVEAVA